MPQPTPLKVTVLLSGSGTTFAAIQQFSLSEQANYKITHVISDNPGAFGLDRAQQADIPTTVVDYHQSRSRSDFDRSLLEAAEQDHPDLVVLAGFMRIVDSQFVAKFEGKLLNIHPSLLPNYPGLNTYQRAIDDKQTSHGSTVHFVNNVLDGGALIAQVTVLIDKNETAESLSARVQLGERKLYPIVINWFADRRLELNGEVAYLDGQPLHQPKRIDWT